MLVRLLLAAASALSSVLHYGY